MRSFRVIISIILYLAIQPLLIAQESLGLVSDNYTPVLSMHLNPALIVDQKPWMSVQLAGIAAYARNNLVYAENTKLQKINAESSYAFNTARNKYGLYSNVQVAGPSLSFTYQKHAFGIHTSARSFVSSFNLPGQIGEYVEDQQSFDVIEGDYEIRNLQAKALGWLEIGLSYGQIYRQANNDQYSWGIGIKRLLGVGALGLTVNNAALQVRDSLDYGLFAEADANYFFNEPALNSGRGWGANIGMVYKKMKSDVSNHIPHSPKGACIIPNYRYKIGVSIIDFGSMRFDRNAEQAELQANFDTDDLGDIYESQISDQIVLNRSNQFSIATPAALSVQFDYALTDRIYAAGTLVQNIEFLQRNGVKRANVLGGSIRYESRWLGMAIPVSFYNYTRAQVGLSIRMGPLFVGTDHIIPFILNSDIYAANAYCAIHIPILRNPSCVEKGSKKKKRKAKDTYPSCPKW